MMLFYIGQSKEYIAAEYAKSARSSCRQCKQKIPKDELRLGLLLDDDSFAASYWYHMNCFHFKPRHKALKDQDMSQKICGIEDLEAEDCDKVVQYLQQEFKSFMQNKSGKKKTKTTKTNKRQEAKQSLNDDNVSKKSRSKSVKQQSQQKVKGKKDKKSKTSKSVPKKFMTAKQTKQYNALIEDYMKLSINDLKNILGNFFLITGLNNQAKTGTKDELASKCADGKLFGKIPMCSKCGGGKLRFNKQNGTYKCPGYMQDTDFIHCNATFQFEEVKRQPWIESSSSASQI